jgi:hypothetical protein
MSEQTAQREVAKWSTAEADGAVIIVRDWASHEVLVWFDESRKGWECDECGQHTESRPSSTCVHTQAACRDLSIDTATRIAGLVHKPPRANTASTSRTKVQMVLEQALADSLARTAEQRAERNRIHDERHRPLTSEVTTRQMTDADRRRLEEARRRKASRYATWA